MLHRRSIVVLLGLSLLLDSVQPASACIWDSDTLAAEAQGLPDVVAIIVGRFDRQPAKYYEMRLERVTKLLAHDPSNLAAYDDAGAACDRLGRGDEAIAWMEKKKAVLDRVGEADPNFKEHQYRYLANVGTFWVHRWFKNGADRAGLDEVRTGRDFIAQAIELNPDAHFGREKYQLMAIDLVLREPETPSSDQDAKYKKLPTLLKVKDGSLDWWEHQVKDEGRLAEAGIRDAVQGLTGLIALGNAWESIDVYYALSLALQAEGRSQLAYLAHQRAIELAEDGRNSIAADAPQGLELQDRLRSSLNYHPIDDKPKLDLGGFYWESRVSANKWVRNRAEFMEQQLAAGKHPDTHADFWQGWTDAPKLPPLPETEGGPNFDRAIKRAVISGSIMVAAAIAAVIVFVRLCIYWVRSSNRPDMQSRET